MSFFFKKRKELLSDFFNFHGVPFKIYNLLVLLIKVNDFAKLDYLHNFAVFYKLNNVKNKVSIQSQNPFLRKSKTFDRRTHLAWVYFHCTYYRFEFGFCILHRLSY